MQLKQSNYHIRPFEKDDLGKILSMYKGPDGSLISKDLWEWQYIKNPVADGKNPGIVGEDGEAFDENDITLGKGKVAPVPEPATILLLATGLAGLAGIRRKKLNPKTQ